MYNYVVKDSYHTGSIFRPLGTRIHEWAKNVTNYRPLRRGDLLTNLIFKQRIRLINPLNS